MKIQKSTFALLLVFLIGLSLLLYPTASDWWNSYHQSKAIAGYSEAVTELDDVTYERCLEEARQYNNKLIRKKQRYHPSLKETKQYEKILNISGNGIMGYIEIPVIGISLPIYHGVADETLQIAIGHIEGSSLPVGGIGTHCVISGHRGLPSARLFTDIDKLEYGDIFLLRVLDEVLTYEVDQIHIVEPHEVELLEIERGKDLCTLVTCTPYGINSHRLLVQGHRIENQSNSSSLSIASDAGQIDLILVISWVVAPVLIILLIWILFSNSRHGRNYRK